MFASSLLPKILVSCKWVDALICPDPFLTGAKEWAIGISYVNVRLENIVSPCSVFTPTDFGFAYIFHMQMILPFFFFDKVEHNTVIQAGSHCCAALQYAPLSHQNKALQCVSKSSGVSQRKC